MKSLDVVMRAHTEPPDFVCPVCSAKGWVEKGSKREPWTCIYCGWGVTFCRHTSTSDLWIYSISEVTPPDLETARLVWTCHGCHFHHDHRGWGHHVARTPAEMVEHLERHVEAGHKVEQDVIDAFTSMKELGNLRE